jgi:3-oxoacyl-[acyl-carrier-protein] synthase II
MKGVVVTGVGMLSCLGRGEESHRKALLAGKTGLADLTLFEPGGIELRPVGEVQKNLFEHPAHWSRTQALAVEAAADALEGFTPTAPGMIAVGTTTGGINETEQHYLKHRGKGGGEDRGLLHNHPAGTVADRLVQHFKLQGERHTFSTACSSSANAIGYAAARIEAGLPWALAGGADGLCRVTWCGFYSLKLLAAKACQPFDVHRSGLSLGEAAAFLLLEREDLAKARGAEILGRVTGWGLSADAHHMTSPHPEGAGAVRAIKLALDDAGVQPNQIDYVNAHGTATPANDKAEAMALQAAFGEHLPLTSSTKGMTGHTLGAAGAIEAAICLIALAESFAPPTVGLVEPDPDAKVPHVAGAPIERQLKRALSNSFGFGGNNTALVLEGT